MPSWYGCWQRLWDYKFHYPDFHQFFQTILNTLNGKVRLKKEADLNMIFFVGYLK